VNYRLVDAMVPARFRETLGTPPVGRVLISSVLARLPLAVDRLAALLLIAGVHESYRFAGAAAGAAVLGIGVGNPMQARMAGRFRPGRILEVFAVLHAAAAIAFVVLVLSRSPAVAQLLGAFALGAFYPAVGAAIRAAIPRLVGSSTWLTTTAYALEGTAMEAIGVSAPLLLAVAVSIASAAWALIFAALLMLVSTFVFVRSMPSSCLERATSTSDRERSVGSFAVFGLLTVQFTIGFGVAAMSVAVVAFATTTGAPAIAGVLLAVDALASLVGGLIYAAKASDRFAESIYLPLLAAWAIATVALTAADSAWTMAPLLVFTGIVFAAMATSVSQTIGALVTGKSSMEIFSWMITAWTIGGAVGASAAGALTQAGGWRLTLLVTGTAIAVSTGIAWLAHAGPKAAVADANPPVA